MANLTTVFHRQTLHSPLILASGIWGTTASLLVRAAHEGCGAVTAKSCGPNPRSGHVNPTCLDWGAGLINAIGLANPGVDAEVSLLQAAQQQLRALGVPLIASIFAGPPEEFGQVAATILQAQPQLLEVNISCPNVHSDFGEPYAANPEAAAAVTGQVRAAIGADVTLVVKLAPNVPAIARIAAAVVEAGADALCVCNTMPGMLIDVESGQPILANISGGISGPALKPIALKCVYDVHKALPETPIIGVGGVSTGTDVLEMLMAGATAVGIGSVIQRRGPDAIRLIQAELVQWLDAHAIADLDEIRGRAHVPPQYAVTPTPAPAPAAH